MSDSDSDAPHATHAGQENDPDQPRGQIDGESIARHLRAPGPAPVHLWDPPYCGEMDLRITRDGAWIHEGRPVRRDALVRLFAAILKKEGDRYYLVTPVEKVGIQVDDCPFIACLANVTGRGHGQRIEFQLNTGDSVLLDRDHPLIVSHRANDEQPHPVVRVRRGLEALLSRNVFYQLVELAEPADKTGGGPLGVWSEGCFFPLEQVVTGRSGGRSSG